MSPIANITTSNSLILSPDVAKDSRDFSRARQLLLKPHDRTKSKRVQRSKVFNHTSNTNIAAGPDRHHQRRRPSLSSYTTEDATELAREPLGAIQSPMNKQSPILVQAGGAFGFKAASVSAEPEEPVSAVEVPITSLLRPFKPRYVFGSDFEIIQRPDRVIVLDDMDEDEEDWEYVVDPSAPKKLAEPEKMMPLVDSVIRATYAEVLKAC